MNKLAIPAILAATVLVAGIFAFMPVQQASTVHLTLATGDNTSLAGEVTDGTTTLTSTGNGITVGIYTYTTDEVSKVLAIEVTADFSGQAVVVDAGDLLRIQALTLDGRSLDIGGDLPITVAVGNGAGNTMSVLLELAFVAVTAEPLATGAIVVTPNTDLVLTLNLVEDNGDADTAIPVTVTFFTEAPGSTLEDSTRT